MKTILLTLFVLFGQSVFSYAFSQQADIDQAVSYYTNGFWIGMECIPSRKINLQSFPADEQKRICGELADNYVSTGTGSLTQVKFPYMSVRSKEIKSVVNPDRCGLDFFYGKISQSIDGDSYLGGGKFLIIPGYSNLVDGEIVFGWAKASGIYEYINVQMAKSRVQKLILYQYATAEQVLDNLKSGHILRSVVTRFEQCKTCRGYGFVQPSGTVNRVKCRTCDGAKRTPIAQCFDVVW